MKENKKNIIRTWRYLKKSKINLLGYLLVSIGEAIISIILPITSAKIILNMTEGIFDQLIYSSFLVLLLNLVIYCFSYLKTILYRKIYNNVINSIKIDLSRFILELEIEELDKSSSGFFIDRINKDSEDIAGVFMEFAY